MTGKTQRCAQAGGGVWGVLRAWCRASPAAAGRLMWLLLPTVAAQAQPAQEVAIVAARLPPGHRLALDGSLTDPAWQRAAPHRDFVERFPDVGARPAHDTEVRVLYDDDALYVGVRAFDPDPSQIRAPLVRHDGVNRTQDFVVVYIDAIGSRQSAQFFRVNAAGSQADGMHTASDDSEDFAPDFDWDAATLRDAEGYTAVLRIPFASLRFASERSGPWRIMVARRVPRGQFFLHSSVLIPRDAPSFIARLQPLRGLELPDRSAFLTLRPGLTWRRTVHQPAGLAETSQHALEASLDLKWRPRAELVVDATLRPDFSQLALDVPQLSGNTRFALSFPEKRPFFFESSDLLRSPTDALYSRSFIEPSWGLRATWRGARLAGTAFALSDRGGGSVLLPGSYGTGLAAQPPSQALAGRLRVDADALQWGGLLAARRYADGRGDNQVLGPDLAWQIDARWRLRAQWLQSSTSALPDGSGQLRQGPGQQGHRAFLKLNFQAPLREAEVAVDDISASFRHDAGFVNQAGVRKIRGRVAQGWTGLAPLNELWLNLEGEEVRALGSGTLVSRELNPGLWVAGPHNLEAWLYWHGGAALRTAEAGPLLAPRYWKGGLVVTPARWAPLLSTEWSWGRLADVQANAVRPGANGSLSLTLRPLPRLELEPSVSAAWLERDGRRTYRETAGQLLAVWHLGPRQSLRAIVQRTSFDRLAEPGIAAQQDQGSTGSLTYAWRRSTGTVLYLGASRERRGVAPGSRGNEAFVKLQVDIDEVRRLF